jgi:hypothetical protein
MDNRLINRRQKHPKKILICLLIVFPALGLGTSHASFISKMAIGLNPAMLFSLKGNYRSDASLSKMVLPGPGLGLSLRYKLGKNIFLDGSFSYNWMYFRAETRPSKYADTKPAFVAPMYTLNGSFYPLADGMIKPYITIGGGICPWWFSSQPTGGELWKVPANSDETFTKLSRFIDGGLGIEVKLGSKISVLGEAKYYHIFAKDPAKFGADGFTDQDLLGIRLGISFYFGGRDAKKIVEDDTL